MSFTLPLGSIAPDFSLPCVDGSTRSLADFQHADVLIVVFTCNHCHYAYGMDDRLNEYANSMQRRGVAVVAINSNDTANHPDDSFDDMIVQHAAKGLVFPYLRDESQDVARAYGALKTPHFFVFDAVRRLRYTGRFDDNPRDTAKATTRELPAAVDAILSGAEVAVPLTNPIGCNVKWRGQDEHWMPADACDLV